MVMRVFATLAGFVAFGFGLYYMTAGMKSGDQTEQTLTVAFSPVADQRVEMELPVTDLMVATDPFGPNMRYRDAFEWSEAHLQVFDANGAKLNGQRRGHARYTQGPVAGISDSFLVYRVTPGATYTLNYTPNVDARISYSAEFVVPDASQRSQQVVPLSRV